MRTTYKEKHMHISQLRELVLWRDQARDAVLKLRNDMVGVAITEKVSMQLAMNKQKGILEALEIAVQAETVKIHLSGRPTKGKLCIH